MPNPSLSKLQEKALEYMRTRAPGWGGVGTRYASTNTLMSLVKRGLLERRIVHPWGHIEYRLAEPADRKED